MELTNTRRGNTQQDVNNNCHSREFLSGMTTNLTSGSRLTYKDEALNKNAFRAPLRSGFTLRPSSPRSVGMRSIGAGPALYPALKPCGMTKRLTRGFTLIELLVVVLIIGILAAVALPQYQKAVRKSRAALEIAELRTIAKAQAVCKLEDGKNCRLLSNLDVEVPWECQGTTSSASCTSPTMARLFPSWPTENISGYLAADGAVILHRHGTISAAVVLKAYMDGHFECGFGGVPSQKPDKMCENLGLAEGKH